MAADPAFFERAGPFSLEQLAAMSGGKLLPTADIAKLYVGVAPLDKAGPDEVSFLDNPKYIETCRQSRAGVIVLNPKYESHAPETAALILSATPYKAYALISQKFHPKPRARYGIHSSAVIDPSARLGGGIEIGPGVVIETGAQIGAGSILGANVVIGPNVQIGPGCRIGALCVISHAIVGAGVTLHPGVKIGQDGFGFAPDPQGHVKVPQLGRVIIGNDCDIGANSCIDRGAGPDTVIGAGCWIDNLVQIGHNAQLGQGCIVIAQAGVAGSTRLGDFVTLAAQVGVAGHLSIGAGARIAAQSGVMRDIEPGEAVAGSPAVPVKNFFRQVAILQRLAAKKERGE